MHAAFNNATLQHVEFIVAMDYMLNVIVAFAMCFAEWIDHIEYMNVTVVFKGSIWDQNLFLSSTSSSFDDIFFMFAAKFLQITLYADMEFHF